MKRLAKVLLAFWLFSEWYTRGGREWLLGEETGDDEQAPGARFIRSAVKLPPPTFHSIFPPSAAVAAVGMKVEYGGEVIGEITSAEVDVDARMIVVGYSVEREPLGWPITVAISQAEHAVAQTVAPLAISTE